MRGSSRPENFYQLPLISMKLPRELLEMVGNYCQVHQMAAILRIKGWEIVQSGIPENDSHYDRTSISSLIREGCLELLKLYHKVMSLYLNSHDLDTACRSGHLSIDRNKESIFIIFYMPRGEFPGKFRNCKIPSFAKRVCP